MVNVMSGRFDERRHPRSHVTGRFLPANNPTPDPEVIDRLRTQAESAIHDIAPDGDRTGWRQETRRLQVTIDALFESFGEFGFADEVTHPGGTSYLVPSRLVHDLERAVRELGGVIDREIHARIGTPDQLHDAEAREAQAVLEALHVRSMTFDADSGSVDGSVGRQLPPDVAAADAEVRATGDERQQTQSRYADAYHRELQSMLRVLRPMGGALAMTGDASTSDTVRAVLDDFPAEWIEASNESDVPLRVAGDVGARSGYRPATGDLVVGLPAGDAGTHQPADGQVQAAHELVHRFEAVDPSIRMMEWGFFHRRTTSTLGAHPGFPEEPEPLAVLTGQPGYEDELCCPDHFTNPYIGRVYEPGSPFSPFEVLAVGVESLRTGDNGIHDDPDWRSFTVGMLAGG